MNLLRPLNRLVPIPIASRLQTAERADTQSVTNTRPVAAQGLSNSAFYWLATVVVLSQLPHVLHMPIWVSLCGILVVALWIGVRRYPTSKLLQVLQKSHALSIMALLGAVAVRLHYGYILGRDPGVALLFLLTACKFAETKETKDASLLICLCGFLLLTQYFYSQSLLAGLITLPAVLATGAALHALVNPQIGTSYTDNLRTFKKVTVLLIQGLPIALILFVLFPRIPTPLWNLPSDANAITGLSDSMQPGTIASLSQSHAVAFRVEFDDKIPSPDQLYWRGPVLSNFDGRGWSSDLEKHQQLPPAPDNQANDYISYTVSLQPNHQNWLFALEQPASLPVAATVDNTNRNSTSEASDSQQQQPPRVLAKLSTEQQLITPKPIQRVTRYRMTSLASDHYPSKSPSVALTQITGRNSKALEFARDQRKSASSDYDYATQIMRWFRNQPFYYTLEPGLLGDAPVDEFLFSTRRGFCEHYASAFTYLMRAAGIPSRVVTGYQGGEMNGDYMIVRQSDAHAWSEVWLDGVWQRFDPTAAVAPHRIESGISSLPGNEPVPLLARKGNNWARNWSLRWDKVNHDWQRLVVNFDSSRQRSLFKLAGFSKPSPVHLVVLMLVLFSIWALFFTRTGSARKKASNPAERLWQRTCRVFKQRGVAIESTETPAQYSSRLQAYWPDQTPHIESYFNNLEQLRFAKLPEAQRRELQSLTNEALKDLQKRCKRQSAADLPSNKQQQIA